MIKPITLDEYLAEKRAKWRACYWKKPEQYRKNRRKYYQYNREHALEYARNYNKNNRLKRACHVYINAALHEKLLVKPDICDICHKPSVKIQSHHDDYTKPFDVVWCCGVCHKKLDAKRK